MTTDQIIVTIATIGASLVVASILLVRRSKLSFRYFAGWFTIGVACVVVAGAVFVLAPDRVSQGFLATFVAVSVLIFVGLVVQLSISVSGLQRQLRDVTQALALSQHAVKESRADHHS